MKMDWLQADVVRGNHIPAVLHKISHVGISQFEFAFDVGNRDANGDPDLLHLNPMTEYWQKLARIIVDNPVFNRARLMFPGEINGYGFGWFLDFELDYSRDWKYKNLILCHEILNC